ncbi:MAG: ADP-glyceromanno-heptose 6-epimerase [Bacteroidetes bacterium]|nr:ADP-glyceromanno-heptose 6-epimerase [Bacteroidota bacterium]
MIIITGAAGFIGSCLIRKMNNEGHKNLLLSDDFSRADKNRNLRGKQFIAQVHRDHLAAWLERMHKDVQAVFHIGARTDTTEKDVAIFDQLNLNYSKTIWELCARYEIPLIYASSAATYGLGELGYKDDHGIVSKLQPLNPYGDSKNDFDKWVLEQEKAPPFWAGMKFFNVYGPNEYHKSRMASVIFHTARQIKATGGMKLFRSHRSDFEDGQQSRDFIYVKDVLNVLYFLFQKALHSEDRQKLSGLYNLGTGQARSFWDLATNTFQAMDLQPNISFIDTPEDIRDTYQYFTEADMKKLQSIGYNTPFYSLEEGIGDYVRNYLMEEKIW